MTITYSNVAVTSVFLKRGNTIQNNRYLGLTGEVTVDTQAYTLRIHDGIGTGGQIIRSTPDLSNISSSILPSANVTYSLGSPTRQWKDIYVSGNTIYMGGTSLSVVNGNLQVGGNTIQGGGGNVANLWNSGKTVSLGTNGITTFPGDIYFNNNSGVIEQGANRLTITGNAIQVNTGAYFNDDGEATIFANTSVQITTDSNSVASKTWGFSQAGKLTFAGTLTNGATFDGNDFTAAPNSFIEFAGYTANTYVGLDNNSVFIQTNWNTAPRQWTFDATGNVTFPDNTVQQTAFSNTAPIITVLTANSYQQQALIGNLQASAYSNVNVTAYTQTMGYTNYSNVNLTAYLGGAVTIGGNLTVNGNLFLNGNTTLLNTNNLIINDNIIYFANANPANSLDIGFVGHFTAARYQHTGLVRQATSGQWQLFSNVTAEPGNTIDFTNAVYDDIRVGNITSPTITGINANVSAANVGIIGYVDQANTIQSGQIGAANLAITTANTAMKGYVDSQIFYSNARVATYLQSGNIANISAAGNVTATYFVGNGALLTGIAASSNYSNVQVATYLPTYAGNIANIRLGVAGVLTFADGTTQTTAATGGGSSYSNVNVAAYLTTNSYLTSTTANLSTYAWSSNVTTANTGVVGYVDLANTIQSNQLTAANTAWAANAALQQSLIGNLQASAYSNVNLASYLAGNVTVGTISLTGNVNANNLVGTSANTTITAGTFVSTFNNQGNVLMPNVVVTGNVTAAYFLGNGALLTGIVASGSSYGNTQVATYLPTYSGNIANITLSPSGVLTFADGTTQTTAGGGSYSNVNVSTFLANSSTTFINSNIGTIANLQASATSLFLGANTAIVNAGAAPTFGYSTHIGNNIYFDANGVMRYRNTQTGASDLIVGPGTLYWYASGSAVTANTATGWTGATGAYMGFSTSGVSLYNGAGLVSSGPVTIQSASGLITNQSTIAVFNGVGTTINMGGVATTVTIGSTATATGNVFFGGQIGSNTYNLTLRANGQYNLATSINSNGGFNSPPYANQAVIGGSGTGMTANYSATGGYLTTLTIYNVGTGYKNGDVISVPGGIAGNSFVLQNYNSGKSGTAIGTAFYTFGIDGNLTAPGNISITSNSSYFLGNTLGTTATYTGNVTVGGNLTITGTKSNIPVKAGVFVAQNTAVSMDSITAQWLNNGGANANQLQLAALNGNVSILYTYTFEAGTGGSPSGGSASTTLANLSFGWTDIGGQSGVAGDMYNLLVSIPGVNAYRITAMTGSGYSNNVLTIERLI